MKLLLHTVCAMKQIDFLCILGYLTNFRDIFRNYNRWNKLWYDVLAIFPFEIFGRFLSCNIITSYNARSMLRLPRVLFCLRNVPLFFARWENTLRVHIVEVRTLKLIIYIYFVTHLCACFLYRQACSYEVQR